MSNQPPQEALRAIASIDRLLREPVAGALMVEFGRERVLQALRQANAEIRANPLPSDPCARALELAARILRDSQQPRLTRVINATGVVLHTNLGRSPLSPRALERIEQVARGYCNLEFDLETGQRGSRYSHVKSLMCRVSGARDALFVNNCAAALMLVLDELARGKEAVVSRGELVEIGGSFRLPDVLARAGAHLVEVGTTNRTYIEDYAQAVTDQTGLFLSTHLSNFVQLGFTHKPTAAELVSLGRQHGVPTCFDLGSGSLAGFGDEPVVRSALEAGFDVVVFSGDKLLGGPQLGIVLAEPALIARLSRNPLTRALRPDKLSLAALEGTLLDYQDDPLSVPVLGMLAFEPPELELRARSLASLLESALDGFANVGCLEGSSSVGGGSAPGQDLPTWLIRVQPGAELAEKWARALRQGDPPVVVRRSKDALLLDPRTLLPGDNDDLVTAFGQIVGHS